MPSARLVAAVVELGSLGGIGYAIAMKALSIITVMSLVASLVGCVSSRRIMDLTAKQSSTCEVHHLAMTTQRVGMTFGMKRGPWFLSLWEARSAFAANRDRRLYVVPHEVAL